MEILLGILIVLVLTLIALMVAGWFRKPTVPSDLSTPLQALNQSTAVMSEKLTGLASVPETIATVQNELTKLSERVSTVERNQNQVNRDVTNLATGITEATTLTRGLTESANAISRLVSTTKTDLTALQAQAGIRQEQDQKTARSIERLEAIIAGTQSKGKAGENILDFVFAQLPAEWQIRNLQIRSGIVEFALRLPNDLALPIDSKWAATNLIEQYEKCVDPDEQKRLKNKIEEAVLKKAKEVQRYIDPNRTANFAIAAVPDPVYNLCAAAAVEAHQRNVVLIGYSMFLPYLMLVFQTMLKNSRNIDLEKLAPYLEVAQKSIQTLQEELDGRMARAITMLGNSRNEMSVTLSKLGSGLVGLQIGSGAPNLITFPAGSEDAEPLLAIAAGLATE